MPVAGTAVGGALVALLEAEFGLGRAADLLRYLRGPSGFSPGRVDWFERALRRGRVEDAETALALWQGEDGEPPRDLLRLREAAARSPRRSRPRSGGSRRRWPRGRCAARATGRRWDTATGSSCAPPARSPRRSRELAELGALAPAAAELAATIAALEFRVWSGPVEGRVRIASPYRLRAARFDHVFVASLQDGEFPRRDRGGDPFLSEAQRRALGLDPRRDSEAEERYLFAACLSLPRRRLFLSYRDSDENGAAEARSPLLDEVRALLAPAPDGAPPTRSRRRSPAAATSPEVVHPLAEAPSEDELARALAAHGASADAAALLAAAGVGGESPRAVRERGSRRPRAPRRPRGRPGRCTNPAAIASLAAVPAYGGTTLERSTSAPTAGSPATSSTRSRWSRPPTRWSRAASCTRRSSASTASAPAATRCPAPPPSPPGARAGGSWSAASPPSANSAPTRPSGRWRGGSSACSSASSPRRPSARPAASSPGCWRPPSAPREDSERPALELDGWGLHGAIDRVDRAADGRAVVIDYKLSGAVTPREKFEEQAKLQLPLYLLAVAEHWGAEPVGGLYHPLRGTSVRRPRGVVAADSAGDLPATASTSRDVVDDEGLEELLADSRAARR